MGQRHQQFIVIPNPAHYLYDASTKKRAEKIFGKNKTAVVPYHNQWLFGRSALGSALGLLEFTNQFKSEDLLKESFGVYDVPFSISGLKNRFTTIESITSSIGFLLNYRPKNTNWLNAGIGSSWFIGETDEGIVDNFTYGDNNDGITIIDVVNKKYCFMNISSSTLDDEDGELMHSASDLPSMTPVSAHEYVKAYYGETIETTNPYYLEGMNNKRKTTFINKNIKINKELVKGFEGFEVLTLDEIQEFFPKMKLKELKE
jgi:hypothetical protein